MDKSFTDTSIRYYRKRLNLKQSELAQKLGVTNTDMSFIENKTIYPSQKIVDLLISILGVTIGQIYTKEELDFMRFREAQK